MPQREKTPPPPDDEPKYLTVVNPYPPHANMELLKDQMEFAFWIACCIGKDPLTAFFFKPRSPNMIIIEVARNFPHFDRLLGEHRWSEIFLKVDEQYKNSSSKVFYCTHNTGRKVQKHGWKRVDVQERWFRSRWSEINNEVVYPYPPTHYCKVPYEEATNDPLCRPLPVQDFQPPPKPVLNIPPVGAPGWKEARKMAEISSAWHKGPPSAQSARTSPTQARPPASPAPRTSPAWGRTISPSVRAGSTPEYAAPPGLTRQNPGSYSSAWSDSRSEVSSAWTATSAPSRTSSAAGSSTSSDGGSIGRTPAGSVYPDLASVVGDDADDVASLVESLAWGGTVSEFGTDAWNSGQYAYDQDRFSAAGEPEEVENLWGDEPDEPVQKEPLCKAHGVICRKGICREYARQLREAERQKEADAKAKAAAERKSNKKKNKGKGRAGFDSPASPASPAPSSASSGTPFSPPSKPQPKQPEGIIEFKPRPRPAHLSGRPGAAGAPGEARPLRGRKAAANQGAPNPASPAPAQPAEQGGADWGVPTPEETAAAWGAEPERPASPEAPATPPAASASAAPTKENKSWADQMEDDDAQSVASLSTASGWGRPRKRTWG